MPFNRHLKTKRYQPYRPNVGSMVRTALRTAIAARQRFGSQTTNMNNTSQQTNVRFNNMGERGSVTTVKYKRRKRQRLSKRKRRYLRTFKRRVQRIVRQRVPISTLNEWTTVFTIDASTQDMNTYVLNGGYQLTLGNASSWGLNLGQAAASGGQESSYINTEMNDIKYATGPTTALTGNAQGRQHYVGRRYSKLTIQNLSTSKDLIFDLYQCVAAQDIADSDYANPMIAWSTCRDNLINVTTGVMSFPEFKGVEPTDCPLFGKYWKVLKKQKVRIPLDPNTPANAYQTFKMSASPMFWDGTRTADKWAIKGKTKYWLMIIDPERGSTRYSGTESVAGIYIHRNTHYRPIMGPSTPSIPEQWQRLQITAPNS